MSNRTYSAETLNGVLASMGVTYQTSVERYGSGHINDTFKVETKSGVRYILQRVNTDIFPPEMLKANVLRVTEHLAKKGIKSLEVKGYENPWRLYSFLEGYTSIDLVTKPAEAELVAGAFAKFQNDLADLPAPRLGEIIPKFHNTVDRLRLLDEAAKADVKGRKALVAKELAWVDQRREEAARIVNLMASGDIPERITHNDTKINNVMLAPDGTNVVIDLDTTMPARRCTTSATWCAPLRPRPRRTRRISPRSTPRRNTSRRWSRGISPRPRSSTRRKKPTWRFRGGSSR